MKAGIMLCSLALAIQQVAFSASLEECRQEAALIRKTYDFVTGKGKANSLIKLVNSYESKVKSASAKDAEKLLKMGRSLRRRVILSHPKLNFKKLLINKRPPPLYSHNVDQYLGRHSRVGDGLCVLTDWKTKPKVKVLLKGKLPEGSMFHPDLSYDGKKILFSFCDHEVDRNMRQFFIYEAMADGSAVRQVTGNAKDRFDRWGDRMTVLIEDFDPCYLPDGGMVFTSTRCQTFGRCHGGRYTPSYLLYRGNLDGTGIRIISFGEANELDPAVLPDGNIVYTRWEYVNRHDTHFHSLWTTRLDGTNTRIYYGNYTVSPYMTAEAKAIPNTGKVMVTAMGHHSYTAGSIVELDPRKGTEGTAPVKRLTPEVCFPESEGWPESAYATPWPIDEDIFFAAYSPNKLIRQGQVQEENAYGIDLVYHIDGKAYREEIYRDPAMSSFSPIPLRPRKRPRVIPSSIPESRNDSKFGIYMVQDVYKSTQPLERGSVKYLRVNQLLNQPSASVPNRSFANNELTKKILGTVRVAANGSCAFRAPAGVPLQLQALDENGMALLTMRSFIYLQPGEVTSCVGCHEDRNKAPVSAGRRSRAKIQKIKPPAGPQDPNDGFSFVRTVQPVLDRYCIGCHGLGKHKQKPELFSLVGTPKKLKNGMTGSVSYENLVVERKVVKLAQRNKETVYSKPSDYFSHASKLARMLKNGHHGVQLDRESWWRIVDWLDVNVQFAGSYSFNRPEHRTPETSKENALRRFIAKRFGKKIAAEPFSALVNNTSISESRILKGPLSSKAGGWGTIAKGWKSTKDPDYKKMYELAKTAVGAMPYEDLKGTCGRDRCICGCCWIRKLMKPKYTSKSGSSRK